MKQTASLGMVAAAAILIGASWAQTAPQASPVALEGDLDFAYENPKLITLRTPTGQVRRFWFMRFQVTNRSNEDKTFVPEFLLYTDTGQTIRAGTDVPRSVFEYIKKSYNDPLLKDLTAMTGKVLQGADNAKRGVAIWPDFDPKAGGFDIFVGGLSDQTVEVPLPRKVTIKVLTPEGLLIPQEIESVTLARTLQLQYDITGDAPGRKDDRVRLKKKVWVMR